MPKRIDEADVFAAVSKVFVSRGYENTTTKELAEAAGMHQATLFRKYKSKVKLIVRAIEHEFSQVPLAQLRYTGNLEVDLVAIVSAYMQTLSSHGDIMPILLIEIPRYPELEEALAVPMQNIAALTNILEQYQARGLLVQEDALQTVAALFGPLMVKHLLGRSSNLYGQSDFNAQAYVRLFLQGRQAN